MDHATARRVFGQIEAVHIDADESGDLPQLDGYMLDRVLGRGAGGSVYRGFRAGSDHPLAIKILNSRLGAGAGQTAPGGGSGRAWRELDVLAQLRLPALPRLIDHGVHDGRLFIVSEFVDGQALDDYCGSHELDRRARVELLAKVADAVQGLHEAGVIHRDIKPSNVIVDVNGRPMIIDLGIASLLTDDVMQTLTADGAPIGTPAFMSPEQARGVRGEISTRSDVYGLGATACLILTGQTPFDMDGTLHATVHRVAEEEPRGARTIDPDLPKPLAAVLDKAVSREPSRRYASAGDLAADLRRWLAGEPVEASPPSAWRRTTRWIGRHPILTTAAACLTLAVLTILGTFGAVLWLNQRPNSVAIDPVNQRWAQLRSISDRRLREWRCETNGKVDFADLVWTGESSGVVVTLIRDIASSADGVNLQLCVWDMNRPNTLLWRTPAKPPDIKAPPASRPFIDLYRVAPKVLVEDIFPENEGKEIVVIHGNMKDDPNAIRVYSLDGDVLYEAWHWGAVHNMLWLEDARTLVVTALNNEKTWRELGHPEIGRRRPRVVFALRPKLGQRVGWINDPDDDGPARAAWYKYLVPPQLSDGWEVILKPHIDSEQYGRGFELLIERGNQGEGVLLFYDAEGQPIGPEPTLGDGYKQRLEAGDADETAEQLPTLNEIGLEDEIETQ